MIQVYDGDGMRPQYHRNPWSFAWGPSATNDEFEPVRELMILLNGFIVHTVHYEMDSLMDQAVIAGTADDIIADKVITALRLAGRETTLVLYPTFRVALDAFLRANPICA